MKKIFFFILVFILIFLNSEILGGQVWKVIHRAQKQTRLLIKEVSVSKENWEKEKVIPVSPRSLDPKGNLILVPSRDWTSGFFPGVLWYLYEYTGQNEWLVKAREYSANIEQEKTNATTHDMGFKIYCSLGNGYRLTNDPHYRDVIVQSALTLSRRFSPITRCIRSWDHNSDKWGYPVIIDNIMNLELLFAATQMTGDSAYYKIAVSHANTTMLNHFRPDFSSYHVIDYDILTGKVLKKNTYQGYSNESAWARGQAWALYGFTMCYRETHDQKYLRQAENIASFILNHPRLPADLVPYWDFDAPNIPNEPRDASAAAIIASALYELAGYSVNGKNYQTKANEIIQNLTENYRAKSGEAKGFILMHSTGSKPGNNEVDVPLSYADYYYLEALLRSEKRH